MTEDAKEKTLETLRASGVLASLKRHEIKGDEADTMGTGISHGHSPAEKAPTITEADVDQIMSDITRRYSSLTPDQVEVIRAKLQAMVHAGGKNLGELIAQAEQQASSYAQGNTQGLTSAQEVKRLASAIHEDDKKISGLLAEMEKDGVVFDPEKKRRMVELQAWVDAHPDDKSAASYHEYVALQTEMAKDGERQANDPHSGVTDRPHVQATAQKIRLTDEDRQKLQKEYEAKQKTFNSQAADLHRRDGQIPEDDDFNLPRQSKAVLQTSEKYDSPPEGSHTGQLSAPQFAGQKTPINSRTI